MRKIPRIVKGLAIFSGLAFAWQAQGVDRIWSNTLGGDFTNSANWVGGNVPGALDNANFLSNATHAVTFSTSVTNVNAHFNASGGTVTLDVGSNNLYYVTQFRVPNNNIIGDASVDFTSGNLSTYKVYVGDPNAFNAHRMTVSNPGTTLTTRGDDITVGVNGSGNLFYVTNGALVACGRTVYAGYAATSSNNTVVVSGTGTRLSVNTSVMIGRYNVNNRLVVEDGAEVACTNGTLSIGDLAGADYNSVMLRSGSVMTNGGNAVSYVGKAGAYNRLTISNAMFRSYANLNVGDSSSFNRLEVLEGGAMLLRTHLYIGAAATSMNNTVVVDGSNSQVRTTVYDINVGNFGHYNTMLITNGAVVSAYRSLYVGTIGGSSYNRIVVSGTNSVLRSEGLTAGYSIAIGKSGTNNTLRLEDGATFACPSAVTLSVGTDATTFGNSVFIGSGCMVTNPGNVSVGEAGNGNSLILSNATLFAGGYSYVGQGGARNWMTLGGGAKYYFTGHFHVGLNASAVSNTLLVTGSGTILTNQNFDLDVGYYGSANRMRIADNAEVTIKRSIFVGHNAGASNNVLEVEGGTLRSLQTYISGAQSMTVSNACTLAVYGSNSVVQAKALKIVDRSRLDIRVGKEGFTPIAVSGTVTFDDTTKLAVDAFSLAKAGGGTVTLMTYVGKSGTIAAQNITVSPQGTTVNQTDGNSITIHVPSLRATIISIY